MKIAVISDTHGNVESIMSIRDQLNDCDAVFFLGDGEADLRRASRYLTVRVFAVRGNNDFNSKLPIERVVDLCETKFYLTHGHSCGVNSGLLSLSMRATEKRCQFALYGHTHIAGMETCNGITFLNPGSLTYPRAGTSPSYAVIERGEKGFFGKIVFI